jgi:tRNA G18 (ribose-2'-O)-methylase SpoU
MSLADESFAISMAGKIKSLNAGVAAGIIMYELSKK